MIRTVMGGGGGTLPKSLDCSQDKGTVVFPYIPT